MNDLRRSFMRAKLATLPADVPGFPREEEGSEEQDILTELHHDDDTSSTSSTSSTGTIRPSPTKNLFIKPKGSLKKSNSELPWTDFFSQELYLRYKDSNVEITYHAYLTPPTNNGPLFICHHGAGSSGLSFAACAFHIRSALPDAGILSVDCRGHGDTTVTLSSRSEAPSPDSDFSLETLTDDFLNVIRLTQTYMHWQDLPQLVLVGHSLGGAVVVNLANRGVLGSAILGYIVIDVVEGSAIDALKHMNKYLETRPSTFPTVDKAIEWHLRSRTIRDQTSARVSVPSLIRPAPSHTRFIWRTPLASTEPYWNSWFTHLSSKFLSARGAKLLLLAGTDRLDKELTIGQMQGKYQLVLFPDAGHFVQEDLPERTAATLVEFWRRNDRSTLVLPPKVGEVRGLY